MVKASLDTLMPVYEKLFNSSSLGTMPQTQCGGLITPIYNSSGSNNPAISEVYLSPATCVRYLKPTTPQKCHVFKYA